MRNKGFTLIEMSVVIVIISLLVGGIFVGQSLIRSANLNGAISDSAKYSAAFTDFRDKYMSLPGDMPTAESYWGTPAGGCPDGTGAGHEVCNGNGDGQVYNTNGAGDVAEARSEWIELANAGFITGSYHYQSASTGGYIRGVNTPTTSIGNATFMFFYGTNTIMGDSLYPTAVPYNIHWLALGGLIANAGIFKPVVTGKEAYALDVKLDDGKPGLGAVRSSRNGTIYGNTPNCHTTNDPNTALYDMSGTDPTCYMLFKLSQ